MNKDAVLTKREDEVAELLAWGATKKDVAQKLFISIRTVENHTKSIFEKIGVTKINEMSAWWFCTHYHISFELSPLMRKAVTIVMLVLMIPSIFNLDCNAIRANRCRISRTARRSENDNIPNLI